MARRTGYADETLVRFLSLLIFMLIIAGCGRLAVEPTVQTGWFTTGQDADLMLSGIDFNNTGGALLFNHPGNVATDGTRLLLADRNNNRILIWNQLPTANTAPDLVLGQGDLNSNNPGTGINKLNWPVGVATDGTRLVAADTYNNRILIWNTFPTQNGQAADLVIENDTDSDKRRLGWPWGVWTNGKKLIVSGTQTSNILIWNEFPTINNQEADIYLTANGKFGTPRTITSNGNNLIVGDHNPKVSGMGSGQGNFFWKTFPTTDEASYDFFRSDPSDPNYAWLQGDFTSDGKLILLGRYLYIWNSFPTDESDNPDLTISSYNFNGGDGSGAAVAGDKLYISVSNGNKIVGYNSIPTSDSPPDFAVGADNLNTNTLDENYFITNPIPATNGQSLFVSSDFDRKLYLWKELSGSSGVHPDSVISLSFAPWDNTFYDNKLVLAGKKTVSIWNSPPLNGGEADLSFTDSIGNVNFADLYGVTLDAKYFYLSDSGKIYVWEGIPDKNTNPKFTILSEKAERLSSDGTYLTVTRGDSQKVDIYKIADLSSSPEATTITGESFNIPAGALVANGHLFVADTWFNRVFAWEKVADALAGKSADIILGEANRNDTTPEIGRNKLFGPAGLAFDGKYLWVGEFKFSNRLLRFSVH